MKFSGKMWLMIILKVTKKHGFNFSSEDTFLEKPQIGDRDPDRDQIDTPPAVLWLRKSVNLSNVGIIQDPARLRFLMELNMHCFSNQYKRTFPDPKLPIKRHI